MKALLLNNKYGGRQRDFKKDPCANPGGATKTNDDDTLYRLDKKNERIGRDLFGF